MRRGRWNPRVAARSRDEQSRLARIPDELAKTFSLIAATQSREISTLGDSDRPRRRRLRVCRGVVRGSQAVRSQCPLADLLTERCRHNMEGESMGAAVALVSLMLLAVLVGMVAVSVGLVAQLV